MYSLVLVDDEPSVLQLLGTWLQGDDSLCVAGCFFNGRQALAFLEQHPVDMIVSDIRMPILSGLELADIVSRRWPDTQMTLVTGYGELDYALKAIELDVVSFLLKPIQPSELRHALTRMSVRVDRLRRSPGREAEGAQGQAEIFFADALNRSLPREEMLRRFAELQLPFPFDRVGGAVLQVRVNGPDSKSYHYENDMLFMAILNVLRTQGLDLRFYPLYSQNNHFYIIALHDARLDGALPPLRALEDAFADAFHFAVRIRTALRFRSMDELVRGVRSLKIAPHIVTGADEAADPSGDDVIRLADQYMRENLSRDISRYDVARHVYMNPEYLSRYFRRVTKESFSDHLLRLRMQQAMRLLARDVPLSEIHKLVGYSNHRYFARVFREYTTQTPSEYRRMLMKMGGAPDELSQ